MVGLTGKGEERERETEYRPERSERSEKLERVRENIIMMERSLFCLFAPAFLFSGVVTDVPSASGNSKFTTYLLYATSVGVFLGNEVAVFVRKSFKPLHM